MPVRQKQAVRRTPGRTGAARRGRAAERARPAGVHARRGRRCAPRRRDRARPRQGGPGDRHTSMTPTDHGPGTERLWTARTWPFITSTLALMTFIAFESFAVTT